MGTPEFAVPTLRALVSDGHRVEACYTRPPSRHGRGRVETPSPVHLAAMDMGIPVHAPPGFRDPSEVERLAALRPDVIVVAAYGVMLPRAVIAIPPMGCLNVHASLLPRWRGAAPIQRAILAGDEDIGLSIMQIDAGMDTGPIRMTRVLDVARDTAGTVTQKMADEGAGMMMRLLRDPQAHPCMPQPVQGTHAAKLDKFEAHLTFEQSAEQVERMVRAYNPSPGAWTTLRGVRTVIHRCQVVDAHGSPGTVLDDGMLIACGHGSIRPLVIQRAGRRAMPTRDVLHGLKNLTGERCG